MYCTVAILDSAYRGGHYSKITFIVRALHITLYFLHLCILKIGLKSVTCLCAKNTWFSNAIAYVNISSRFYTTYFSPGGPWPPLKIAYGIASNKIIYIHACMVTNYELYVAIGSLVSFHSNIINLYHLCSVIVVSNWNYLFNYW